MLGDGHLRRVEAGADWSGARDRMAGWPSDSIAREVKERERRWSSSDAPAALYSSADEVKAGTGGRSRHGIARDAKPDWIDAKLHQADTGRALNRNEGVAGNGPPW